MQSFKGNLTINNNNDKIAIINQRVFEHPNFKTRYSYYRVRTVSNIKKTLIKASCNYAQKT